MMMTTQLSPLSNEQIFTKAPAVFAEHAHEGVSSRYSFISTQNVLDALRAEGIVPVSAKQSRTRNLDKRGFTLHELRFALLSDLENGRTVGDTFFQILMTNSHDRAKAFGLDIGLFKLLCSNGMAVPVGGATDSSFRVRHTGDVSDVIEGVYSVVAEQEQTMAMIGEYAETKLLPDHQRAFAAAAAELAPTTLEFDSAALLRPRRYLERGTSWDLPKDDLWSTLNVVQENLVKGGVQGRNANGRRMRTRTITGIDTDQKLNKALFVLAEQLKSVI